MNTGHCFTTPDGLKIRMDGHGYMLDPADWNPEIANALARSDGFELSAEHWEILQVLRNYYAEYELEPPIRALTRLLAAEHGKQKANSRHLYRLFPDGPVKQGCRYAGLPLPLSCI